jgi:succinyl-diaminopimelate desuccinylase
MMTGVQDFIARGHADSVTAAVVCEPQDGLVCIAQKGAVRARFAVHGRMSHGAMPLSGLNPAPAVARIIDGLAGLEAEAVEAFGTGSPAGLAQLHPDGGPGPSQGPPQLNVVPGEAEILVDVRTIPGQDHDAIRQALSRLARQTVTQKSTTATGKPTDAWASGAPGSGRDGPVSFRPALHPHRSGRSGGRIRRLGQPAGQRQAT